MRRNITRLLLASALSLLALAPRPAEAGPLCEPPPAPACAAAFNLCRAATPDACAPCENADILSACAKCLAAGDDCDPAETVCDLVAEACKGSGDFDQDCDAQRADCELLFP